MEGGGEGGKGLGFGRQKGRQQLTAPLAGPAIGQVQDLCQGFQLASIGSAKFAEGLSCVSDLSISALGQDGGGLAAGGGSRVVSEAMQGVFAQVVAGVWVGEVARLTEDGAKEMARLVALLGSRWWWWWWWCGGRDGSLGRDSRKQSRWVAQLSGQGAGECHSIRLLGYAV